MSAFARRGWLRFPRDPGLARWAAAAGPMARAAIRDGSDWRCGGTWFPGIDALGNDAEGAVAGVPFPPVLADWLRSRAILPEHWHRAQISACLPGYPRPDPHEGAAQVRFRRVRDAAHVDGLLPIGEDRRRMLREPHGFVLGLPLTDSAASPLVVWEGSHEIVRAALGEVLRRHPARDWPQVDLTDAYQAARRTCLDACARVELPGAPGTATLLHRLALHGVAPWRGAGTAPRIVAYFRHDLPRLADWIERP